MVAALAMRETVAWPPQYLKDLPPDYLNRVCDTLAVMAQTGMEKLHYATATREDSIL